MVKPHKLEGADTIEHPTTFTSSTKQTEPVSIKDFIKNLDIKILKLNKEEIVFDLVGVEPPLANALRRIMISEIPTMAIEKAHIWQNKSVIPDEVLAHRLGLIPIKADARLFEEKDADYEFNEKNSIKFVLGLKYKKTDPEKAGEAKTADVFSRHLKWVPLGDQEKTFGESIRPIHEDILLNKLRPNQELLMELYCEKGIGKTHAKWSPVSTAYYRLVPDITIKEEITGEDALELKKLCPVGVFDIEDIGSKSNFLNNKLRKINRQRCKEVYNLQRMHSTREICKSARSRQTQRLVRM